MFRKSAKFGRFLPPKRRKKLHSGTKGQHDMPRDGKGLSKSETGHFFPGIFVAALVPGQRDSGTRKLFHPRTKRQRDIPSRIVQDAPQNVLSLGNSNP